MEILPHYDDWKLRAPEDDTARFESYFEDWQDDLFFDYLERDVLAYQKIRDLIDSRALPNDPANLSLEQGQIILRLAKSQNNIWDDFTEWAFKQWAHEDLS